MKKIFLIIIMFFCLQNIVFAGELLLTSAVTGTGQFFGLNKTPTQHTVCCYFSDTDTSISAITIQLLGSIDNDHYKILTTYPFTADDLTAKFAQFSVYNVPVDWIKINLSTLTGGNGTTDIVSCSYVNGKL